MGKTVIVPLQFIHHFTRVSAGTGVRRQHTVQNAAYLIIGQAGFQAGHVPLPKHHPGTAPMNEGGQGLNAIQLTGPRRQMVGE